MTDKIALCTFFLTKKEQDTPSYVSFTNKLKNEYVSGRNIDIVSTKESPHEDRDATFCKTALLLYALMLGYKWAVWMDADAAPVGDGDLEAFLSEMPNDKVVIMKDINGWNAGVYAVPNHPKVIEWLLQLDSEECHDAFRTSRFLDQDAIADSFKSEAFSDLQPTNEMLEKMHVFGWNMYDPIYPQYTSIPNAFNERKSWCLHIPGYYDTYRWWRFNLVRKNKYSMKCPACGNPMSELDAFASEGTPSIAICHQCGMTINPERIEPDVDFIRTNTKKGEELWNQSIPRNAFLCFGVLDISLSDDCELSKKLPVSSHVNISKGFELVKSRKFPLALVRSSMDFISNPIGILNEVNARLLTTGSVWLDASVYDHTSISNVKDIYDKFSKIDEHTLNLYSIESLRILAARCGFRLEGTSPSDNIHVLTKVRES